MLSRIRVSLLVGVLVVAACTDAVAPPAVRQAPHPAVASAARERPLPLGFREDERATLAGTKTANQGCQIRSEYFTPPKIKGAPRRHFEVDERLVQYDPVNCTAVVARMISEVATLEPAPGRLLPTIKDRTVAREIADVRLDADQSMGNGPSNSEAAVQVCNESSGEPGYAYQETVVEDPIYIDVNNDQNEVWYVYNWQCIHSARAEHTMRWFVASFSVWARMWWGWYPWWWGPNQDQLNVTTFSSYRNNTFPACLGNYVYTDHNPNEIRMFADGALRWDARVSISGDPFCAWLLTWRTWRSWVT